MNIKGNRLCAAYVNDGGEAGIRRVYDDATRAQTEGLFDSIPGVFTAEDIRAGEDTGRAGAVLNMGHAGSDEGAVGRRGAQAGSRILRRRQCPVLCRAAPVRRRTRVQRMAGKRDTRDRVHGGADHTGKQRILRRGAAVQQVARRPTGGGTVFPLLPGQLRHAGGTYRVGRHRRGRCPAPGARTIA